MTNSHQNASKNNGCFTTVLYRFLCSGGLPTHPSSDIDGPTAESTIRPPSPSRNTTTPAGIVARLMGIDSFPNSPKLNTIMQKSRSVGSLDFLPNFHVTKQPLRHVTTSISFRELPSSTFLHDVGKSYMGLTPIQEKTTSLRERFRVDDHTNVKNKINNNKKKNTIKKPQSQSQSVKVKNEEHEVTSMPLKIRRRRVVDGVKKKVVEDGFPDEKRRYKSRSKTYNHPLPKMGKQDTKKGKKKSMLKRRESEYSEEFCIEVLKEVCSLTMVEIEGGVWVNTKVVESYNIQEVSYEICQQILHVLVYEMVDELCRSL